MNTGKSSGMNTMRIACNRSALCFVILFLVLSSCKSEPTLQITKEFEFKAAEQGNPRFQVSRVAVFEDELAYNSRRGIYIIYDSESGKQFVGISGIGISELGSRSVRKTGRLDER